MRLMLQKTVNRRVITSGLVPARNWIEHLRDLLQLHIVTLSVADHDGLDQAIHILRLGSKCVHGAFGRGEIFSEL